MFKCNVFVIIYRVITVGNLRKLLNLNSHENITEVV